LAEWLEQPVKNPVMTNTTKAKENFILYSPEIFKIHYAWLKKLSH
jgi:hypothetical protein